MTIVYNSVGDSATDYIAGVRARMQYVNRHLLTGTTAVTAPTSGVQWIHCDGAIANVSTTHNTQFIEYEVIGPMKPMVTTKYSASTGTSYVCRFDDSSATVLNHLDHWREVANTWGTVQWCYDNMERVRARDLQIDPKDRLRRILRDRCAPAVITTPRSREYLPQTTDLAELRARDTLRMLVGEKEFRKFLRTGFVSVQNPKSGRVYTIHPGYKVMGVYKNGQKTDNLCVVLRGKFPPTDSLIVKYLMAVNNEDRLWELANRSGPGTATITKQKADQRSLVEIFRDLKAKSA